jgi:hypothetical protein
MPKAVLCENSKITVWLDDSLGLIHHQMHGPCYGDEFRAALTAGTLALKRHGLHKWLSDDRAHVAMPPEDEEWAKTVWFPETLAAGWRIWALVQPKQVVGQMNLRRFTETYAQLGITVRVFTDPGDALHWVATT